MMMIRLSRTACLLAWLGVSVAVAGDRPLQGVQVADVDRKADPCNDFFDYANGKWRTENPIPASMPRWSRRWAAGESTKDQLRQLLEAAAKTKAAPGSSDQLTGDFYAGCMNETAANQLGAKPIQPLLAQIDQIRTPADLQHMIATLHGIGVNVAFGLYGESDAHEPSQVIAQFSAGGLGMPDRDYYFKSDDRFRQAREKYQNY